MSIDRMTSATIEPFTLTEPAALLSWTDVVITEGRRGSERVLLAAVDLRVFAGERVCLVAADATTRAALVALLTGERAPLYGTVRGLARSAGPASGDGPVHLVLGRGSGSASVVVAADPADAPQATRTCVFRDGALRVVPQELRWDAEQVSRQVEQTFVDVGVPVATARMVAQVLVAADVRGHRSHGVQLVPMYLDRVRAGGIVPEAEPEVIQSNPIVTVLSANGGFGQVAAERAARLCATKAREHGLAAVAVRDNNHVGMLAAYRQPFVDAGVVALVLNISGPSVAAPGASRATLGNDAICVIAPQGPGRPPLIADLATGVVAAGKIRDAAALGRSVPKEWLIGPDGRPSTNPFDLDNGGAVPVFGGAESAYKGLCITVIVEVLAGMLAGATVSPLVSKQRAHPESVMNCSQMFIGFDPVAFAAGDIEALTQTLVGAVAAGHGAAVPDIYFPEQKETLQMTETAERGIVVPGAVADLLGLVRP
ncbi:MAG TPA: Ldh family oxidoreductase [Kineosporiaceae bacterium]|nr:Ldh family oxidoreductase [Kineosporiaceae bacterium]